MLDQLKTTNTTMGNEEAEVTNIEDLPVEDSRSVAAILRYCKQRIVYPYLKLLGIMGLKPFLLETSTDLCRCARVMNKIYIVFVTLMLIVGYVLQFFTCYRRDRGFSFKNDSSIESIPINYTASWNKMCHGNSIYIHILPSILHLSSFLYMIFLYRLHDDEQLPNIIERVFIQASQAHTPFFTHKKPMRTFQYLVILSITWIVLSCACQLVQISTHNAYIKYFPNLNKDVKNGLVVLMGISNLWQDVIQVTVIVSYCIHCYLLSSYLNLIHARIQQHSISLKEAIKEIGELVNLLKYLNDELAPGLGPLILLDTAFAISGFIFLFNGGNPLALGLHIWDYGSVGIMSFLWFVLILFPIVQIVKLTKSCNGIREVGHIVRLRPFGYQNAPQCDLDSFLLFVSTLRMEVYIFKPISTKILTFIIIILLFSVLTWGLITN